MGNKKQRLNYQQQKELEVKVANEEKKHRKIKYVIIPSVLGGIVLITALFIFGIIYMQNNGVILRNTTALSSENFKIDNAMMTYFAEDTYNEYLLNFADSLVKDGLDTEKELDAQTRKDDQTWRDYFIEKCEETAKDILVMAESAKAAGYELTETELKEIEDEISGKDLNNYPKGINRDDMRRFEKIYKLAVKYDDVIYKSFTYNDDEIQSHYEKNPRDYMYYDYRYYSFSYSLDSDDSDQTLSQEEAKEYADKLNKATDEKTFVEILKGFYTEMVPEITDKQLESELETTVVKDSQYVKDDTLSDWVFEDGRKVGEIFYEHSEEYQCYAVYCLLKLPYRKDTNSVNVRHILFSSPNFDSDYEALDKASAAFVKWEDKGKTEEEFIRLAKELTDDNATKENGGLYENLKKGETVEEFDEWCFDESRKEGDCDIVKTEYGYHLIYYVGQGIAEWKIEVYNDLLEKDYIATYEKSRKQYPVEVSKIYSKIIPFN